MKQKSELFKTYIDGPSPKQILNINHGFVKSRVLETSIRLKVYDFISEGFHSIDELVKKTNANKEPLEKLLDCLVSFELLTKQKELYYLTSISKIFLVSSNSRYLGKHLFYVDRQWDNWFNLTKIIKDDSSLRYDDEQMLISMSKESFSLSFPIAINLIKEIDIPKNAEILDLYGGEGEWAIAAGIIKPESSVYVCDSRKYESLLNHRIKEFDVKNIKFIDEVDSEKLLNRKFDVVFLCNQIRFIGIDKTLELLKSIHSYLKNDGVLVIYDVFEQEDSASSGILPSLSLSMYVNTRRGSVFQTRQIKELLHKTNYHKVIQKDTDFYPMILARR